MNEDKPLDPLRNPKDPLLKSGPQQEQELMRAFGQVAHGFPRDTVLNVVLNMLVTTVRQSAEKRDLAERLFDDYTGKAKNVLLERHYDNLGNRRNIFPFTQNVEVPFLGDFNKQKF